MGGNALLSVHSSLQSEKMNRSEYDHLKDYVSMFLDSLGINYRHVKFYHTKSEFGDLDIIVSRENDSVDKIRDHLKNAGLPMTNQFTMSHNVDHISTLIDKHQIDFIIVEPEQLESATTYYSYNDIWNLLGKVIKTHEYKLGWQGLLYTYRDGNHHKEDILLTHDLTIALEIMGLSVDRYNQGFDTHYDMFDYVISSKAFDPSKFALENLNHRNRVRDRKRKTYNMFLEYISGKEYPTPVDLPHPTEIFQALKTHIKVRDDIRADNNRAKTIINGNIIVDITGLQNRDIKDVLENIRCKYDTQMILKFTPDDVRRIILETCVMLGKPIK